MFRNVLMAFLDGFAAARARKLLRALAVTPSVQVRLQAAAATVR